MKTQGIKWVFTLAIMLFFIQLGSAQTYTENDNDSQGMVTTSDEVQLNPTMLSNLGISTTPNPRNSQLNGNSVFLTQVGDANTAVISTNTNSSEINLLQNGDFNTAILDYTANTVVSDLVQNGNNNRVLDYVNNPRADASINLVQQGSNLNFERQGINNLTKSIKFKQSEATPNIIIRSIN